ncbi:MAG: carboxypeptidase regulatory-like domain-containing protein [Candidatus Omnitrophica bacterium]|nr:carboxypeptidase regulatory-like domain-containing protein [Candidatus Omnitrophota bacterium]
MKRWLTLLLLSAIGSCLCRAESISYIQKTSPQASRLQVKVVDESNQILPCCLSLTDSQGNSLWGLDALGYPLTYRDEPRIWISGEAILYVTADDYQYVISRPFRHRIAGGSVSLQAHSSQLLDATLECIVDLPAFGWYGGDAHQHVVHGEQEFAMNLEAAARIARSEGGDWSSFNSAWSSVPDDNPSLDDLRRMCADLSGRRLAVFVGDEYPKDHLGHMALLSGSIKDWNEQIGRNEYSYPANEHERLAHFEILKRIFDLGGISVYTHPVREYGGTEESPANIARELPFDILAAPELVPSVDWMTDNPHDEAAMKLWAMHLNRGYKIGLCAFTDTCYDRHDARPFHKRTFVFLGTKRPTAANLIEAIRNGHTFGTTGPLMLAAMNGLPPGAVFPSDGQPVIFSLDVYAPGMDYGKRNTAPNLDRIEIVRNGEIYRTHALKFQQTKQFSHSMVIREENDAWYIVKAFAAGERQVAISSPFYFRKQFQPGGRFPHPEPVHAHVTGSVIDASTGEKLAAKIELIEYDLHGGSVVKTASASEASFEFDCPPTWRIRASADGYRPQIKSLFFDSPIYPELILPLRRTNQLDPRYYEKIKAALQNIRIDFALARG